MTQKEILQNMNQGEWSADDDAKVLNAVGDIVANCELGNVSANKSQPCATHHDLANAHAIASAVNNTYGKGFNPETVSLVYARLVDANELIRRMVEVIPSDGETALDDMIYRTQIGIDVALRNGKL